MNRVFKRSVLLLTVFTFLQIKGTAQNSQPPTIFYAGIGAGLDYGGIGFKVEAIPVKYIGVFGGAGYNFHKLGINGGLSFKMLPGKKVVPVLMGMYGYNGVIRSHSPVTGNLVSEKTYYGFSAGAGCDIHFKNSRSKLTMAIVVPFRSNTFKKDLDYTEAYSSDLKPDVSNVLATIGFNFGSASNKQKK